MCKRDALTLRAPFVNSYNNSPSLAERSVSVRRYFISVVYAKVERKRSAVNFLQNLGIVVDFTKARNVLRL